MAEAVIWVALKDRATLQTKECLTLEVAPQADSYFKTKHSGILAVFRRQGRRQVQRAALMIWEERRAGSVPTLCRGQDRDAKEDERCWFASWTNGFILRQSASWLGYLGRW